MKENKNVQQINIELTQEVSEGEYANFVVVTHSPAEFVMDFTKILPGVPKPVFIPELSWHPSMPKHFWQHWEITLRNMNIKMVKSPCPPKKDLEIILLHRLRDHFRINKRPSRPLFLIPSF